MSRATWRPSRCCRPYRPKRPPRKRQAVAHAEPVIVQGPRLSRQRPPTPKPANDDRPVRRASQRSSPRPAASARGSCARPSGHPRNCAHGSSPWPRRAAAFLPWFAPASAGDAQYRADFQRAPIQCELSAARFPMRPSVVVWIAGQTCSDRLERDSETCGQFGPSRFCHGRSQYRDSVTAVTAFCACYVLHLLRARESIPRVRMCV